MLNPSLVDQIQDILKERIVSLQLKLGEKINVQELTEEFGVSQTPVRDALNMLSQNGLVKIKSRVGYYVVDLSAQDLGEIYDLRKMFETYALKSALNNIDFDKLGQLKRKMEEIGKETNGRGKRARLHEADKKLHLLIINSSTNKRLRNLFSQIYDFVRISISMGVEWEKSLEQHLVLIDALRKKDLPRAEKILTEHIDYSKDNAIKVLETEYNKET